MARIGTITVPVKIELTTELNGRVIATLAPDQHAGNVNPSLNQIAAAMNGMSPEEFDRLSSYTQNSCRDLAHNILQVFQVTPR